MIDWLPKLSADQLTVLTTVIATLAAALLLAARYLRKAASDNLSVEVQAQPALRWRGWFLVTLAIRNTQGSTVDVLAVEALRHPKDLIQRERYERQTPLGDPNGMIWPDSPPGLAPQRTYLDLTLSPDQTAAPPRLHLFIGPAIAGHAIQRSFWLHWKSRSSPDAPIRQRIDF